MPNSTQKLNEYTATVYPAVQIRNLGVTHVFFFSLILHTQSVTKETIFMPWVFLTFDSFHSYSPCGLLQTITFALCPLLVVTLLISPKSFNTLHRWHLLHEAFPGSSPANLPITVIIPSSKPVTSFRLVAHILGCLI